MTNEWLQGYLAALSNIRLACELHCTPWISEEKTEAYSAMIKYIDQVKENYKQLVKDLNEKSKG